MEKITRKKITEGNTAEIFEVEDKKVLKLFKEGYSKSSVQHEYNNLTPKKVPVIMDFANICKAPKEYDVARMYFLLKEALREKTVADFYLEKMQMEYKDISAYYDVLKILR